MARLHIREAHLKEFKVVNHDYVFTTTQDPAEALVMPLTYAIAVGCFFQALEIPVFLENVPCS